MNKDELLMTLSVQLDYAETIGAPVSTIGNKYVKEAIKVIEQAEPVRHGHWITKPVMIKQPYAFNYTCSECGKESNSCSNYCPNCGAKMDEEVEE